MLCIRVYVNKVLEYINVVYNYSAYKYGIYINVTYINLARYKCNL